jgi:peptide/nickel transport system substrate-binding protein
LALSSPEVQLYDRRDDWWASEIGFHDPPKVERIQYIPVANDDIAGQLYINNQLDAGPPLLKGTFEAAKGFNDALRSWSAEGPVWGAPDGCTFVLILNNQKKHLSSADVRWAINHAINRQEITEIAYEGGIPAVVVPISSFGIKQYLPVMQDLIDKYAPDNPDQAKVTERMTAAGYSTDSEGYWTKDGERVEITLEIPSWIRPQGPFLEATSGSRIRCSVQAGRTCHYRRQIEIGRDRSGMGAVRIYQRAVRRVEVVPLQKLSVSG